MAITVQLELADDLRCGATVILQVVSTAAPDRLVAAMRAARADIWALDDGDCGPKDISAVMPLPDGPIMMVDFGSTPTEVVRTVPRLVSRRLAEVGVRDGEIRQPDGSRVGQYRKVEKFAPTARALLRSPLGEPYGTAPRRFPAWLLDIAASWLGGENQPDAELNGRVIWVEVPITLESLHAVLRPVLASGEGASAVSTDFATSVAAAAISTGRHNVQPEAALTAAGADWGGDEVAERMRRQRDIVRASAADLAWAGVTAEPHAGGMLSTYWDDRDAGPYLPFLPDPRRPRVELLSDLLVPDAMWYQVISAGHLDRLGEPPAGAAPLGRDRFELTVGEPEQWLPGHPDRDEVRAHARALLAGCLVTADEARELTRQRVDAAFERDSGFFLMPS